VKVVIDASSAFQLLTEPTDWPLLHEAKQSLSSELIVAELLNARWKVARRGGIAPSLDVVEQFVARLELAPMSTYAREAAELSERFDHPIYDCFYVAVALAQHAKLVTIDQRLTRKLIDNGLAHLLAI
jgi:predicted nucleic acid-binding protein